MTATGLRERVLGLPDNMRGALWVVGSGVFFAIMATLVKTMGAEFSAFQLAFFRSAFGLLAVVPFLFRLGPSVLRTRRPLMYLLRGACGSGAMLCGFYAVTALPLADAVSISYARGLFLIPMAVLFLGEVVRVRRWTATAVGFVGVVIMLRPGGELQMAILVALSGAVLMAVVNVLVKQMAATERAETLLVYSAGIATLVALVPSLFVWRDPTLRELAFLVLIGALGSAGQYCVIRGFKVGEATALLPFDYSRLLFAGLLGFLVFAEVPDVWTISGAAIIVAATLYIGLRESRIGRRPASPPAETR